jgi:hypothetical protein
MIFATLIQFNCAMPSKPREWSASFFPGSATSRRSLSVPNPRFKYCANPEENFWASSRTKENQMRNRIVLWEAPQPEPFPPGSTVYLRNFRGPLGVVQGTRRKLVLVKWNGLNEFVGKHHAAALVMVDPPDDENDDNQDGDSETDDQEDE